MAGRLALEPGVTLVCPVELNQFMLRFGDEGAEGDRQTLAVIQRIQADAAAFVGPSDWRGRWVMLVSVIGAQTDDAASATAVDAVLGAWRAVRRS